jgi:hypothetical protein
MSLILLLAQITREIRSNQKKEEEKKSVTIEPQDSVLIHVEGWIAEDPNDESHKDEIFQQAQSWLIVVGDGDILPAIEMGVRFMETEQTALVWSHSKYAMGPGTRTYPQPKQSKETIRDQSAVQVPPHSNVMYKITVMQKVMDTSRLNPYFTIQKALTKKKIASDIYQYEWCPPATTSEEPTCLPAMNRAIRLYHRAAKDMETLLQGTYFTTVEPDHPQRLESQQLLLDALNNIVAVHLKQKQYHLAKLASVQVLEHDPHNLKALLRAAKASLWDPASTLEEAKAALKAAEDDITYKHPEEIQQLQQLKTLFRKKQHQYNTQTRKMFGNKLASYNNNSTTTNKNSSSNNDNKTKTKKETGTDKDDSNTVESIVSAAASSEKKGQKLDMVDVTTTTTTTDTTIVDPTTTTINEATTDTTLSTATLATKTTTGEDHDTQQLKAIKMSMEEDDVVIVDDDTIPDPNKENNNDRHQFWKTQLITALVQIVVPLLLYVLYRTFAHPSS